MKYQHILVALELSQDTNVLLERAVDMAKEFNAKISFIHIDGSHGEIYPEMIDISADQQASPLNEPAMEQLRSFEANLALPVSKFLVGTGDLADKLDIAIKELEADLLICGHHHDFWSKIVSYSKHLIDKSPIDILVVPIFLES